MYENATNYNPLANDDDNSCQFEEGGNNTALPTLMATVR